MTSERPTTDDRRPETPRDESGLTFDQLSIANLSRLPVFLHRLTDLSLSDWATCVASSLGKLADLIKRNRTGTLLLSEQESLPEDLGRRVADVVIYCDLVAARAGLELGRCVVARFNEVSVEYDSPISLLPPSVEPRTADDDDVFIGSDNNEVHHKNFARAACNLDKITSPVIYSSLTEARSKGRDLCAWCFDSQR